MASVALIVIYNHQYNKNIEIIENIYRSRFSSIYHLVPFYNGNKSNVIAVYENSYYFQGYVAQGFKYFFKETFNHYLFIADDLILNPKINEENYIELFKLSDNTCFLSEIISIHEREDGWPRINDAFYYKISVAGVEAEEQLPSYADALCALKKFGLQVKPLSYHQIWRKPTSIKDYLSIFKKDPKYIIRKWSKKKYKMVYPFIGGYSDIFLVSANSIKQFCHYCGVFAATNLFVEVALPTSMVWSATEIITEKELILQGKALWTKEDFIILGKFNNNLKSLLENFPETYLYLHPIKLSKWN